MKPIMLGKLSKSETHYTYMRNLGDIRSITEEEYNVLNKMDGYVTEDEIAEMCQYDISTVSTIFDKFHQSGDLKTMEEWNQLNWCPNCSVYVTGNNCSNCNCEIEKILFSPPCDPWIGLNVERDFILEILKNNFDLTLPEESLFIIGNGRLHAKFFWEVVYHGEMILKITFVDLEKDSWQYELLSSIDDIMKLPYHVLDNELMHKMQDANKNRQENLTTRAKIVIDDTIKSFLELPLLYFSAGKESQVMLEIIKDLDIEANVLTVTNGVETPDDLLFMNKYYEEIKGFKKLHHHFYKRDSEAIIEYLNKEKKLSANNPWCRDKFKTDLKNCASKEIYPGKLFIAMEGSRWYENDFRRRHPRIQILKDFPNQVWLHPLLEWTAFDIWMYIFSKGLPVNPTYEKGFQRTTCWFCPVITPFHIYCSKMNYPELWKKIEGCKLIAFDDEHKNVIQ